MNSDEIADLLRAGRYAQPEWFMLEEVPPFKGAQNHLDVVAWSLYASRGLTVEGVEIKTWRSDWLRELKNPAKAEATHAMVESFFICAPAGVVLAGEVPAEWGWLEPQGARVVTKKKAPKKVRPPWQVDELAGVLRRVVSTWQPKSDLDEVRLHAYKQAAESLKLARDETNKEREHSRELRDKLHELHELLGWERWNLPEREEMRARATQFRQLLDVLGDRPAQSVLATRVSTVAQLLAASSAAIEAAAALLRSQAPPAAYVASSEDEKQNVPRESAGS